MAHGAATQPKCRTCGERHLMGPCPVSRSFVPAAQRDERQRLRSRPRPVSHVVSQPETPVSQKSVASDPVPVVVSHSVSQSTTHRYRDAEKRRVYMRDWMRRKRAKERAG